jgi:drug/metabolite transporter (DMT)-like permease
MLIRTIAYTTLAILCFSANSLLCRLALAPKLIDPATFTSVRILSAAAMLGAVVFARRRSLPSMAHARPVSIAALFAYMIFFSFAYMRLSAATGALILIGGVQLTMLTVALREGERFSLASWVGFGAAILGLIYLVSPGVTAPDPLGAMLMAASGVAWGFFTLSARGAGDPVEINASNLLCCAVPALLVNLFWLGDFDTTPAGLALGVASGALATGLGYIVWYLAVRRLPAILTATVQLSMPAVVALGGVVVLTEPLTMRLVVASAVMLGGIAVVLVQRTTRKTVG